MKSPTHVLISAGYGAAAVGLAGAQEGYASAVIAAIAGGLAIDLIDHPLFHLITHSHDPHVEAVRDEFRKRGIRKAWRLASRHEEARLYKPLLLHRLTVLLVVASLSAAVALATRSSPEAALFCGALLLHMICDLLGDVATVGNADNWLTDRTGSWLRRAVARWGWSVPALVSGFVISCLALATIRGGMAATGKQDALLADALLHPSTWLPYLPVGLLSVYLTLLATLMYLSGRIYVLEFREEPLSPRLQFSVGSFAAIRLFAKHATSRSRRQLEQLLLLVQADQAPWTLLVAAGIAIAISISALLFGENQVLVFLIPVITAIFFNTLVHSTIGQLGGSLGAVGGWWLSLLLGRIGLVDTWGPSLALTIAAAAAGSWFFGLLSGVLLRGRVRMSAACFFARVQVNEAGSTPDLDLGAFLRKIILEGHASARKALRDATLSPFLDPEEVSPEARVRGVVDGRDASPDPSCHLSARDRYNPFLRETKFLISNAIDNAHAEHITPVLPRQRHNSNADCEVVALASGYQFKASQGAIAELPAGPMREPSREGLTKSWSEVVDHFNTRYTDLQTDAFIQVDPCGRSATIWGTTREITSTKEYGTIEAEIYASRILQAVGDQASLDEAYVTRVHFPRASIFDVEDPSTNTAGAKYKSQLAGRDQELVDLSMDALHRTATRRITTAVTADSGRTAAVLVIQLILGTVLGTFGIHTL